MKKNLFSEWLRAALLLLFAQPIFAQQNSKIVFPNPTGFHTSQGLALTQTTGGGFYLAGTADNTDWNTVGAYVLPRIVKLNSDLTTAWDNVYLAPPVGNGTWTQPEGRIFETPDGGAVTALRQDSVLLVERDLMKVNTDGSLAWVADLPGSAWKSTVIDVLPNGTTVVARWIYNPTNSFHIVHVDAAGTLVLDYAVAGLNPNTSNAIGLPNGDILFNSYNNVSKKHDLYRIDNQGNTVWTAAGIAQNVYQLFGFADGSVGAWGYTNADSKLYFFTANGQPDGSVLQPTAQGLIRDMVGADGKNLILSGRLNTGRGFLKKVNALDGTTIWEAEVPAMPPPVVEDLVAGTPTADSWGAGLSGGWDDKQLGFFKVGSNSGIQINTLTGQVAKDDNSNCAIETGEIKIAHAQITATNGSETLWTFADALGNYTLQLPAGTFDLDIQTSHLFFQPCPTLNTTVSFAAGANASATLDFPMQSQQTIHSISGKVVLDQNSDCLTDAGDLPLEGWNLRLTAGNQYVNLMTDAAGEYSIFVPDGNFSLEFFPLNQNFGVCGQKIRQISVSGTPQNLQENFAVDPLVDCAVMQTSIASAAVRPCSTRVLQVFYRNDGTQPATAATLDVTLDPALDFVSSVPAATSVAGNIVHFELGTVLPSYASNWQPIQITVLADCALQIGQQVCITSEVAPAVPCNTPPNWQGAIIAVDGYCDDDSAYFEIKNIGSGPQVAPLDFVIVEDQIVLKMGNFNLPPGGIQAENAMYFQDSTSLMMTADQEPGAPAQDPVVFNLTNCSGMNGGGNGGGGGGNSMFTAQQCFLVTNSYDPNDKNAYPLGFGASHIVQPGTPLEYTIRFQNTGNDTAFTVILRDTLDKNFDFARVELLGSSHRYSFAQIENSILHFRFDNILLPDSATNAAASQGFVQFRVYPKANLPLGTQVKNRAAIYFDFNPPILTNTVSRIYDKYFVVSNDEPSRPDQLKVAVAPNPFVTETFFKLPADAPVGNYRLEIFDAAGRQLRSLEFSENQCRLGREGLPQGLVFWKISENGWLRASGKILAGE